MGIQEKCACVCASLLSHTHLFLLFVFFFCSCSLGDLMNIIWVCLLIPNSVTFCVSIMLTSNLQDRVYGGWFRLSSNAWVSKAHLGVHPWKHFQRGLTKVPRPALYVSLCHSWEFRWNRKGGRRKLPEQADLCFLAAGMRGTLLSHSLLTTVGWNLWGHEQNKPFHPSGGSCRYFGQSHNISF